MIKPEKPVNEAARNAALHRYAILDTAPEEAFDDLLFIATAICGTSMGAVTLIDGERQWFKASVGLGDICETTREVSFCAHAILTPDQTLVVADTLEDARFAGNPFVLGEPGVRFYAGAPLLGSQGEGLGSFCVMGLQPRTLDAVQLKALESLSRQASRLLELRRTSRELSVHMAERDWYEQRLLAFQAVLEARNEDLVEQTRTDPLTGLANRRAFAVHLGAALQVAGELATEVHVAMIDIDHFKVINDLHGHAEGDRVLQAVSQALLGMDAARGRVARYGGEEFVLLLPGMGLLQARLQVEFLREAVANLPGGMPVTVSIGLATRQAGDSAETLLARADQALYQAKRDGRDRVVVA